MQSRSLDQLMNEDVKSLEDLFNDMPRVTPQDIVPHIKLDKPLSDQNKKELSDNSQEISRELAQKIINFKKRCFKKGWPEKRVRNAIKKKFNIVEYD